MIADIKDSWDVSCHYFKDGQREAMQLQILTEALFWSPRTLLGTLLFRTSMGGLCYWFHLIEDHSLECESLRNCWAFTDTDWPLCPVWGLAQMPHSLISFSSCPGVWIGDVLGQGTRHRPETLTFNLSMLCMK